MKTKILLSALLSFIFCLLSSQVPQGFNYQAIARDASGNPIINTALPVRITIQSDSLGGTICWIEEHSSVTTNGFGLFTLILGKGSRQTGSTVATFNDIDWSINPKFIKTEINYSGWKTMGSTRLWAVPYSMISGDLAGPVKKLAVTGQAVSPDSALFEVKNKNGQTVFAVYNEGVRVYVDDGVTKGVKGGFAIGGFGTEKGISEKYFVVTADSIRAYIDANPTKGVKGGFAIGGFDNTKLSREEYIRVTRDSTRIYLNDTGTKGVKGGFAIGGFDNTKGGIQDYVNVSKDSIRLYIDDKLTKGVKGGFAIGSFDNVKAGGASFFNVFPDSTGKINPSQNRILWYPLKNAFLTGKVLIQNKDSVGVNSFASGFESKSKGKYSQALGYRAIARGDYSTAIGKNAVAHKINSFAFGDSARAIKDECYAIGRGAVASGYRSFAFGSAGIDYDGKVTDVTRASGDYSFAIGQGSIASGKGAVAIGMQDTAKGNYSVALGYQTYAAYNATAMGWGTRASQIYSTAMGYHTNANGAYSVAMGSGSTASGPNSTAMGYSTASASIATSMGARTTASGASSTAMGNWTTASGYYSTAMGSYTIAPSACETVIGAYNTTYTPVSAIFWDVSDRLFVIGNGTSSAPSNAVTVLKNGNVGIGAAVPGQKLDIVAGYGRVQTGYSWLTNSDVRFKKNIFPLEGCLEKVMTMRGVSFDLRSDSLIVVNGIKNIGFIAQELENVIPEVVITGSDGYKSVAYDKITAVLVEAIKEQQKEIDELKTLVNTLVANQTVQGNK